MFRRFWLALNRATEALEKVAEGAEEGKDVIVTAKEPPQLPAHEEPAKQLASRTRTR